MGREPDRRPPERRVVAARSPAPGASGHTDLSPRPYWLGTDASSPPCSRPCWQSRWPATGPLVDGCLALLALLLLMRCVLDPGDHIYYHVPLVLALAAWEIETRGWPLLALWAAG